MNEETHHLIRLKRHETPPEGYFEDFLEEFRLRREKETSELAIKAQRTGFLLKWWESVSRMKVLGFGMAYATLVMVVVWWPKGQEADPDENRKPVIYQPDPDDSPQPVPPLRGPRTLQE